MIKFLCPVCKNSIKAPDSFSGKAEKCPKCAELIKVPGAPIKVPPPSIQVVLVPCPDCGKSISPNANSCPNCGKTIKAVTIEKTGKKWKKLYLISIALLFFGFMLICSGISNPKPSSVLSIIASLFILAGMGLAVYAKFGKWWHHG